jgi:hypothetical protein
MPEPKLSWENRHNQNKLYVIGPRDAPPAGAIVVNTTSRSNDFGKAFSPFLNEPIELAGLRAGNVENFWQYTKVYNEHAHDPKAWEAWRDKGLSKKFADRYPMGKGARPLCSRLSGKDLDYISARKEIYIPIYRQKLHKYCMTQLDTLADMLTVTAVALWDFDGYLTDLPFKDIVNNPDRKMGHAFVIKHELNYQGFGVG